MNRPKKVAIIAIGFLPSIGGLQNHVSLISEFASQAGYEVVIITVTRNLSMGITKERPFTLNDKISVYQLNPWKWIYDSPLINPATLYQLLKKVNPDLVHVVKPFPLGLDVGVLYAIRSKKKAVCTVINEVILQRNSMITCILQCLFRIYRVITWIIWGRIIKKFSFSSYQYFKSFVPIAKYVNELIIIPPYFLPKNSRPLSLKEKHQGKRDFGITTDAFLVIFIGGLRRRLSYKRLDLVFRAWKQFHQRSPESHLYIVGDGPMRPEYEQLVSELNLSKVKFLGFLPRKRYQDVLLAADCLVLPSEDNNEGFGIVIAEAMQMGVLPVISNLPGPRGVINAKGDVVAPGVRLCKPRDVNSLEKKIWEVYSLSNRQELALQNFEYLKHNFTETRVFSSVKRLYSE